jgi:hypothetical protein
VGLAQVYGVGNKGGEAVTDRELLELAAKAAGIRINYWVYDNDDDSPSVLESGGIWNPLTDDGDALRLAVKLGLTIEQRIKGQECFVEDCLYVEAGHARYDEGGKEAATRRAIVLAAAEIGRNMT